jgi:hypothetical protein
LAASVGLVERVQLSGALVYRDGGSPGAWSVDQARVDVRVQLLRARPRFPVAISLGTGYQADAMFDHALTGLVAASAYLGRVSLTLDVRAAHYFAAGRDALDVFVTAGALVRVAMLRLGAEYVGEELESDDTDGSTGGRHYFGPTAVLFLLADRLRLNVTGGAVLLHGEVGPLVRGALAYRF